MDGRLPVGWESGFDGSRWLYRFTPTGLMQFTFPNPGDEFPHFDAPGAGPTVFNAEEQQQLKLGNVGLSRKHEAGVKNDSFGTKSAAGYFDPSGFMYLEEGDGDPEETLPDNAAVYPHAFVAELATSDTLLCQEELAPVELDAGSMQTVVSTDSSVEGDEDTSTPGISPLEQAALHRGLRKATVSVAPPVEDETCLPAPLKTAPGLSLNPISPSMITHDLRSSKPPVRAPSPASQALLGASGRSIHNVTLSPLQAHDVHNSRSRSKSTNDEPWTPAIQFIQTGLLQESKVATGVVSSDPEPMQHSRTVAAAAVAAATPRNRVPEWLNKHSIKDSLLNSGDSNALSIFSELPRPGDTVGVRDQDTTHGSASQGSRAQIDTDIHTISATSINRTFVSNAHTVVESIIEMPTAQNTYKSSGVQLSDAFSGLAYRRAMKDKTTWPQSKKRFSWETEPEPPARNAPRDLGPMDNVVAPTPRKPSPSRNFYPSGQSSSNMSAFASPRLLSSGKLSSSQGQVTANRAVLFERRTDIQSCTAIVETSDKTLPSMPLAARERPSLKLTSNQPKSHALDLISELIAATNEAMPSAQPHIATKPRTASIDVWDSSTEADSSSISRSPSGLAPRLLAPLADKHLTVWSAGHKRRDSQQILSIASLKPSKGVQKQSKSLVRPLDPLPSLYAPSRSYGRSDPAEQVLADILGQTGDLDDIMLPTSAPLQSAIVTMPKSPIDSQPQAARLSQKPLRQVKVPFYPGLPSSPRPSPMHRPTQKASASIDKLIEELPTSPSTVSSPSNSVFSSVRDSSVSATSSMADSQLMPLTDILAEMAALEKSHHRLVRQRRLIPSTRIEISGEQMPVEADHIIVSASPMFQASPPSSPIWRVMDRPVHGRVVVQRPRDLPAAIRPAGTQAIDWAEPKVQEEIQIRPPIPTLIVRAPTVKGSSSKAFNQGSMERALVTELAPTVSPVENRVDTPAPVEKPQVVVTAVAPVQMAPDVTLAEIMPIQSEALFALKANTPPPMAMPVNADAKSRSVPVQPSPANDDDITTIPLNKPPSTDFLRSPKPLLGVPHTNDPVESADNVQAEPPRSAVAGGFLQSLRRSWQSTTLSIPIAPNQGSRARAKSQSALSEPQGRAAKEPAESGWQLPTKESRTDGPVGSISNMAMRFISSSFQALRSKTETETELETQPQKQPEKQPAKDLRSIGAEPNSQSTDMGLVQTTVVRRKIGPPVVCHVRIPTSSRTAPSRAARVPSSPRKVPLP